MTDVMYSTPPPVSDPQPDGSNKRSRLVAAIMIRRVQDALANHALHEGVAPGRFFEVFSRKEWDHVTERVSEAFAGAVTWNGDEHRFVPTSRTRD